jgi:hypothetical protein
MAASVLPPLVAVHRVGVVRCPCGRPLVRRQPYLLERRLERMCYRCASKVVGCAPPTPSLATGVVVGK